MQQSKTIRDEVMGILEEELGPITDSSRLRDLGDSLELIQAMIALEEGLGIDLDRDKTFQVNTVSELVTMIERMKQ